MNLLSVIMLSLSATSDSFVIGLSFGIKGVRIGIVSNLYISLVCFAGTCLAMLAGAYMSANLPSFAADLLSSIILLGFGLWMLRGALYKDTGGPQGAYAPEKVDKDASKTVELRESIFIGLILALNNCGIGVGAGIARLPVLLTSSACALLSFLLIKLGSILGHSLSSGQSAKILEAGAALILIALGVGELFFC